MEGMSVQARDGATINELLSIAKMALDRWPAAIWPLHGGHLPIRLPRPNSRTDL